MVSEKLLMITERIAILLGNSLDRSSNVTVRKNITTENICKYIGSHVNYSAFRICDQFL